MGRRRHCWCCDDWLGFGEDVCPRCGSEDRTSCRLGYCPGWLAPDDQERPVLHRSRRLVMTTPGSAPTVAGTVAGQAANKVADPVGDAVIAPMTDGDRP